jgi:anti-anti-sigma regulatory factor
VVRDRLSARQPGRQSGRVQMLSGFGARDHACWSYAGSDRRAAAATAWLSEGLRAGYRGVYVADATESDLAGELARVPDSDAAMRRGALVVLPTAAVYDLSVPTDAHAQRAVYDAVVTQAVVADGYLGVCVVADITPLVADPARRAAHLRWEQVADRYVSTRPVSGLCLYDTSQVTGIDAIIAAHPLRGPAATSLGLYGTDSGTAALDGEADASQGRVLADLLAGLPDADAVLDLSRLTFIDGRCARVLSDALAARRTAGQPVRVTGMRQTARRLWDACRLDPALLAPQPDNR